MRYITRQLRLTLATEAVAGVADLANASDRKMAIVHFLSTTSLGGAATIVKRAPICNSNQTTESGTGSKYKIGHDDKWARAYHKRTDAALAIALEARVAAAKHLIGLRVKAAGRIAVTTTVLNAEFLEADVSLRLKDRTRGRRHQLGSFDGLVDLRIHDATESIAREASLALAVRISINAAKRHYANSIAGARLGLGRGAVAHTHLIHKLCARRLEFHKL